MSETGKPIATYREFWPFYLREHAQVSTRAIHIFGVCAAVLCVAAAVVLRNGWFALGALPAGYGPAWIAHFFVEKNRPTTFHYPLWSVVSDFRMTATWLMGRLARELDKAGVASH